MVARDGRKLKSAASTLLGIVAVTLTACDVGDSPSFPDVVPSFVVGPAGCPEYWETELGVTDCRTLTPDEKRALQRQFFETNGPFRGGDQRCAALSSKMVEMFNSAVEANAIYWANPAQVSGYSWEHPDHGILLDGTMFTGLDTGDPYASQRLSTVAHELAHRVYNVGDSGSEPGRAEGPPTAGLIADYCTKASSTDPWTGSSSTFGGGGGNPDPTVYTCVTVIIHHYELDLITGEVSYLGSDESSYCYLTT